MFDTFGAHGVSLVGDDEPGRLAVRRHHERHTGLDVFVVEGFSGDVEEVIAAGLVEIVSHVDHVVECLVGLCGLQMCGPYELTRTACSASVWSVMIFNWVIICGNSLSMASREVTAFAI